MNFKNLKKTLGPGILFASTAIGVSHLVQSTQAGANYGFTLVWAVVLANLFKWPFFEYGSRYANVTGTSLIEGYKKLSKAVLWLYFIITLCSMFFVTAAVTKVTSGFMQNLFGIENGMITTLSLMIIFVLILIRGKYNYLDSLIKVIGITLLLTTLIAFVATLFHGKEGTTPLLSENWLPEPHSGKLFLLALMGWMPTALDLSTWNSIWTVERIKQTNYHPTLKETLFDFNFGYWTSAVLSIVFITMGAFLVYGTNQSLSVNGAGFANDIINLYTTTIGKWAYFIIAIAAFSIMFGTGIAVFDGYSRAMSQTIELIKTNDKKNSISYYKITLITLFIGTLLIILSFENNINGFKELVNFATTLSFLIAPIIAVINLKLVSKKFLGDKSPGITLKIISWLGIIFLTCFSLYFLWIKFNL